MVTEIIERKSITSIEIGDSCQNKSSQWIGEGKNGRMSEPHAIHEK